jgi:hypothetical protein
MMEDGGATAVSSSGAEPGGSTVHNAGVIVDIGNY